MILKTENPHCFEYETEELKIELLGGVRTAFITALLFTPVNRNGG